MRGRMTQTARTGRKGLCGKVQVTSARTAAKGAKGRVQDEVKEETNGLSKSWHPCELELEADDVSLCVQVKVNCDTCDSGEWAVIGPVGSLKIREK